MKGRHKPKPPGKCVNCGQHVKRSNLGRHQSGLCRVLREWKDRGWQRLNKLPYLAVGEVPHHIYKKGMGRRARVEIWVPVWVHAIVAPARPTFLRRALLAASVEDAEIRRAIYACIIADDWQIAADLIPETLRWWDQPAGPTPDHVTKRDKYDLNETRVYRVPPYEARAD